mmetsp:Transcript_16285/g.51163  ORF Transcript_16285/g.51163 Transcript_16285/m.51163 type:complete len:258 (-) Transcript_16285:939-1712(-)
MPTNALAPWTTALAPCTRAMPLAPPRCRPCAARKAPLPLVPACGRTSARAAASGSHCEKSAERRLHIRPATQQVAPSQVLPPHCSQIPEQAPEGGGARWHSEWCSLWAVQTKPAVQQVVPLQSLPPHFCHSPAHEPPELGVLLEDGVGVVDDAGGTGACVASPVVLVAGVATYEPLHLTGKLSYVAASEHMPSAPPCTGQIMLPATACPAQEVPGLRGSQALHSQKPNEPPEGVKDTMLGGAPSAEPNGLAAEKQQA